MIPITPIKDSIIVDIFDRGGKTTLSGLILLDDDFKESGIRPRQAQVLCVGPAVHPDDLKPGDIVLLEHGGWFRNENRTMMDVNGVQRKFWKSEMKYVLTVLEPDDIITSEPVIQDTNS